MKRKFLPSNLIILTLMLFCITSFNTFAQQTKKISLQGFLKDANGKAVADGPQPITFKLYSVASGGTAEWSEDQNTNIFGGVYSTNLGTKVNTVSGGVTDFGNLSWGSKTYYVGVTVQGTELNPRTELTFAPYSLGSPFAEKANIANTVVCSGAVGDVKYSILNPTQFAAVNGNCWVPMDGGNMAGSKLATIIGGSTVPNAGGLFLRGQEATGATNHDPDRDSNSPIATFQEQAMQRHRHPFSGATGNGGAHSHIISQRKYIGDGNGGWGLTPESFPDKHTTSATGDHQHNFSGTTDDNNGFTAIETRPKNLNLWTYIRIN